jgi:hypothetical protein
MKQYKYSLDKSSKKFICPSCSKHTFVKFIEVETQNFLDGKYGRCDRETNCGFYHNPKSEIDNVSAVKNIFQPEPSFHSLNLVDKSMNMYLKNNFIQFLNSIFSDYEVNKAVNKYLIGTSKFWNGATVFWQIDTKERVHAGKILQYDSQKGKRHKTKEGKSLINWAHRILKINDFNLKQCLFGLHLINESNQKIVAIVESEKTAVVMSIFKPEYTWLSTGSKQGFKYEMLKPITDYEIIAFPDKGEYNDWQNKAIELNSFGFNIRVSDWLENTDYENGTDLADIYIKEVVKTPFYNLSINKEPPKNQKNSH